MGDTVVHLEQKGSKVPMFQGLEWCASSGTEKEAGALLASSKKGYGDHRLFTRVMAINL